MEKEEGKEKKRQRNNGEGAGEGGGEGGGGKGRSSSYWGLLCARHWAENLEMVSFHPYDNLLLLMMLLL